MNKNFFLLAYISISFLACKDKTTTTATTLSDTPIIELPKTPEAVVRTWEAEINKNQYNLARLISVGPTLEYVNSLAESDNIEKTPETNSTIVSINCSETGDKAECLCVLNDEFGQVEYTYRLQRNNGQWFLSDVIPNSMTSNNTNQKPIK